MTLVAALAAETEQLSPIIMPPIMFAILAFSFFFLLGAVAWSYRDVSHRQSKTRSNHDAHGSGH